MWERENERWGERKWIRENENVEREWNRERE